MILFFDTETTGLTPGRIVQLSYVMTDGKTAIPKNFFFAVEYVEPSASLVNGFTPENLAILSNGHTFSTDIDEIYDDFCRADLIVAHNVQFDINFLIAEFNYQDRQFVYNESLDTMKVFTPIMKMERANHTGYKYPKLTEMLEFLDIYPYDVTKKTIEFYSPDGARGHDARYDTVSLYLAFFESVARFDDIRKIADKYLQTNGQM